MTIFLLLRGEPGESELESACKLVEGEGFRLKARPNSNHPAYFSRNLPGSVQFNGESIQVEVDELPNEQGQRIITGLIEALHPVSYHDFAYEIEKQFVEGGNDEEIQPPWETYDFGDVPYVAP